MPTTSLAGNVQESKAQRQERLKSRFRDRGGIFVPSEGNPLVDILLSRGVNGESPVKKRPPRKSAHTPKPRSSASRTKTPRTGPSKRAPRKSALNASGGDENYPPSVKKRRDTSRTSKLQMSERANGMDPGTSAGLSLPHAAAQRKPFADQLADAIRSTKTRTVPDSCSTSMKVGHAGPATLLGTPSQQGKRERAPKHNANPVAVLSPRYSDEPNHSGVEHVPKSIKSPALILAERQRREKQGGQMKGQGFAAPENGQVIGAGVKAMKPPLLHDQSGSSSDSSLPLAKKLAAAKSKRARPLAGTRKKPKTSKEEASTLPKKRGRPRVKALPSPAEDPSDKAILEEKIAPAPAPSKVPRKRKERVKASADKDDNNNDEHEHEHEHESTHGLPQKKRRRADLTASRNAKENKEMSRSAREAAAKMDKPLPSPVKKPARASPKPSSKAKAKTAKPRSRAAVSAKSGTHARGLPLDVRRRIEVIARNFPATDFDDDDPIDFLR